MLYIWAASVLTPVAGLVGGFIWEVVKCHRVLRDIRKSRAVCDRYDADSFCGALARLTRFGPVDEAIFPAGTGL